MCDEGHRLPLTQSMCFPVDAGQMGPLDPLSLWCQKSPEVVLTCSVGRSFCMSLWFTEPWVRSQHGAEASVAQGSRLWLVACECESECVRVSDCESECARRAQWRLWLLR